MKVCQINNVAIIVQAAEEQEYYPPDCEVMRLADEQLKLDIATGAKHAAYVISWHANSMCWMLHPRVASIIWECGCTRKITAANAAVVLASFQKWLESELVKGEKQ